MNPAYRPGSGASQCRARIATGAAAFAPAHDPQPTHPIHPIHIAEEVWRNDALRTKIAAQAQAAGQQGNVAELQPGNVERLEAFPIGWNEAPDSLLEVLKLLLGWLITAAAVSPGALFWFDLLGKVANLRGSGGKAQTQKVT